MKVEFFTTLEVIIVGKPVGCKIVMGPHEWDKLKDWRDGEIVKVTVESMENKDA